MKKEDMKKHCSGEKPGSQHARGNDRITCRINILYLILAFFFLEENISPQIPINGFCKFSYFDVDTGFTKILMINLNDDAYSDLLLYNPSKKEAASVYGAFQGEFSEAQRISLPMEINYIQPLNYKSYKKFVFANRKKRMTGIYELNTYDQFLLTRNAEFDSYPDFINTADVNSDGKNEILVSGGAFKGISLLYQEGNKLIEKNIVRGGTYSQAAFIELNNDGYPDIAAYDLMNREFSFFYNNSEGEFRKARSIPYSERPSAMKTFDIDLDSYEDLIFRDKNSIIIWYGDYRSSYEKRKKINTNYDPDKYIYGDFNKDGLIDFVYLNIETSLVSILFAKNESDYFNEITYLRQEGITDIIPYYSRFVNGVAAVSSRGALYTITQISSFTDDVNISIGAKPDALSFFDKGNNGITDFCFIDEYDKKIKLVVRDNTGIPELYFSQQLFENHEKIISENLKAEEKNYICFSYNKKMIEVVRINFGEEKINKNVLYSPGSILDLKVKRENDEEYKILVLYKFDKTLFLGTFINRNSEFNFSTQQVADNVKIADASFGTNNFISVSYWTESEEKILLFYSEPFSSDKHHKPIYSLPKKEINKVTSFTGDLLNMDKNITINFVKSVSTDFLVVSAGYLLSDIKKDNKPGEFRITSKNNLFFGETRFNGLKKLCVYLPEQNIVTRLEFISQGKDLAFSRLTEISQVSDFFIKNMTSINFHVVFSNPEKNCISVKRLKG